MENGSDTLRRAAPVARRILSEPRYLPPLAAVEALPQDEHRQFRSWFLDKDWEKWDRQLEAHVQAGKLLSKPASLIS